jgi:hypothetical protein
VISNLTCLVIVMVAGTEYSSAQTSRPVIPTTHVVSFRVLTIAKKLWVKKELVYVFEHVTTLQQLCTGCHLMQIRHLACTDLNTVSTETLSTHIRTLTVHCSHIGCARRVKNRFVNLFTTKRPTSVRTL